MAQNQCIFEYSNFGNGYLRIYFLRENKTIQNDIMIDLEEYTMHNGVVLKADELIERVRKELRNYNVRTIQSPLLLLKCAECYKNSLFLPVKNFLQAQYLYKKEIKTKQSKDFVPIGNSYKNGVGYIFNTYYIPNSVIAFFNKIEKALNTEFVGVQPLGMFLAENLTYQGTYVYFQIRKKVCTMILVSDKELITSYDFDFEDDREVLTKFLLVASKHEFEVERKPISFYDINTDEPLNVDFGIRRFGRA